MKKNICIVVGARPNFMKVAPLVRAIRTNGVANCQLVYAGRSDDPTLEPQLFDDLQCPVPDLFLGADSQRLNELTAQVMGAFDHYLDSHPTDVVVVVDDLASTMAAAITAKKRGISLAHLVAGTRSFDINMPKEVNRLVIDALSDYLFTAGVKSHSVASREQQADSPNTYMVGNILMDTLRFNRQRLLQPTLRLLSSNDSTPTGEVLTPESGQYIVLTLNRHALLNDTAKLSNLLNAIIETANGLPIIAPLRDSALKAIQQSKVNVQQLAQPKNACMARAFNIVPPMRYLEFAWLTAHAKGIVTDSGNVAEEATWNGVPCITLNSYTEHIETVTVGTNVLVGEDAEKLREAMTLLTTDNWKTATLPDRWDGRTADRIVSVLT